MRYFFTILFGGLIAMFIGGFLLQSGDWILEDFWPNIRNRLSSFDIAALASVSDGTEIAGLKRIIRFTASEEEGPSNDPEITLPLELGKGITAKAYLVQNLESGEIVASQNALRLFPVASLTKLVTAIVARQQIDLDSRITLTNSTINTYGNTASFRSGETFMARDLLYPLLLVSSNDAAEAFAYDYGRKPFVDAMNTFVQSIGAYRTYFADPSGLSPENRSTVTDMAILLDWIRENDPEILEITRMQSKALKNHIWVNPTHFLNWSNYFGGKNGYLPEANRTAAAIFTVEGQKYAVIVFGSEARDTDVLKLLSKISDKKAK